MRPRIAKALPGVRWSRRETARQLGVDESVIRDQIRTGKILADAAGVDALSAYEWYKTYEPHKDNAARRVKARTIPQMQANGNGNGRLALQGHTLLEKGSTPIKRGSTSTEKGSVPVLNTREWVEKFYLDQARAMGGAIRPQTKKSYDWTFGIETELNAGHMEILKVLPLRFVALFETVPLDRRIVMEYLHGLTNIGRLNNGKRRAMYGESLSAGAKALAHRCLATFYAWLGREHGYEEQVPDLTHTNLPAAAKGGLAFTQDEIRAMLALTREHSEYTIILTFAQVACREGELCSLELSRLHAHEGGGGWTTAFGKPTRANLTGERVLYIPQESFEALTKHLRLFKVMSLQGRRLNDGSGEIRLRDFVRTLAIQAGVYSPGKNTHAFRRAYEAEFLRNGGSELVMDELLGHHKVGMKSLYFNMPRDDALEAAIRYAPRRFLQQALASAPLRGLESKQAVPA